jgi:hypothetical protein
LKIATRFLLPALGANVLAIALLAGWLVTALRSEHPRDFEVAAAAALLTGLLALGQWLVQERRESMRIAWEAIKTYYDEGDNVGLSKARAEIFSADPEAVDVLDACAPPFLNFYEKWGRLTELSYLPIEVFDGPSGDSIANALVRLRLFIKSRRERGNPTYARSYVLLVRRLLKRGYIKSRNIGEIQVAIKDLAG